MRPRDELDQAIENVRSGRPVTMRQWPNVIGGWVAGFGLAALNILVDPFGVFVTWTGPGQGVNPENLAISAVFMAIGLGGYAIFSRPSVRLLGDRLVLRNVLRDVTIPYDSIEELDITDSAHLRVGAAGRWYRAWGIERTNFAIIAGLGGIAGVAKERILGRIDDSPDGNGGGVRVAVRGLGIVDACMVGLWLGYVALGLTIGR